MRRNRSIEDICDDLTEVNSILSRLIETYDEESIDYGLKTNIMVMESQRRDLLKELKFVINHRFIKN
jgi:hypothetical protein